MIQAPDITPTDELLEYVKKKTEKLEALSDRIIESRVNLKLDKSETRDNKICEIKVAIPGNDLFSSNRATSFEEACSKSIDALKRQLVDWKEKLKG